MKFDKFKQDQGVAGLTILLSLITMLFVIGLLIFIFVIMGVELRDSDSVSKSDTGTAVQSNVLLVDGAGTSLTTCAGSPAGAISSITAVNNNSVILTATNYTISGCSILSTGDDLYNASTVSNVTYSWTYGGNSYDVINDTTASLASVSDWYDIFIVIGAMVVLILLTVIIITAIRGSGLMAGSTTGGNVGNA